ncbi:protein YdgV [Cedecea davisae]
MDNMFNTPLSNSFIFTTSASSLSGEQHWRNAL